MGRLSEEDGGGGGGGGREYGTGKDRSGPKGQKLDLGVELSDLTDLKKNKAAPTDRMERLQRRLGESSGAGGNGDEVGGGAAGGEGGRDRDRDRQDGSESDDVAV